MHYNFIFYILLCRVATGTLVEGLFNLKVDKVAKALKCQKAEHTFADTPCGIMDQYISCMGQAGNLLLIDCRSKDFQLVNFGSGENTPVILVTNSNVKHTLSGSEYPDRVRQCKEAVTALKKLYPHIAALRDANMVMLNSVKGELSEVAYRRAKHAINEDIRTLATVNALKAGDYATAGKQMIASHVSLRDDFEVSCEELNLLVDLALQVPGVYGARMTGGGFGGCTVTLVDRSAVSALKQFLYDNYYKHTHTKCDCYDVSPSSGARILDLPASRSLWSAFWSDDTSGPRWLDIIVPTTVLAISLAIGTSYFYRNRK